MLDKVVIATGSYPFVPPVPGINKRGVFVYRTIEDLERIIKFGKSAKRCAVMGGGLLGLEAAKAAYDLGLETHVIEFADRLMPRQLDLSGSEMLCKQIQEMGVHVHSTWLVLVNTKPHLTARNHSPLKIRSKEFIESCYSRRTANNCWAAFWLAMRRLRIWPLQRMFER